MGFYHGISTCMYPFAVRHVLEQVVNHPSSYLPHREVSLHCRSHVTGPVEHDDEVGQLPRSCDEPLPKVVTMINSYTIQYNIVYFQHRGHLSVTECFFPGIWTPTHPSRNANNIEAYTFVTLFLENLTPPPTPICVT